MLGRYDEAHAKITEALARRGKRGDKRAIATSLSRLGDVQQDRGQYETAYTCHKEALELRKQAGDRWGQVVSQNNLAALAFELGELGRGARRLARGAARGRSDRRAAARRADPDQPRRARARRGQARRGAQPARATRSRSSRTSRIAGSRASAAVTSRSSRSCRVTPQRARELAERALEVAKKAGLREKEAQAYLTLGDVLSAQPLRRRRRGAARHDAAVAYAKAIDVLRAIGNEAALGKALFAFGRYKAESGALGDGKDMLRDAIALFARSGSPALREMPRSCCATLELIASAWSASPPTTVLAVVQHLAEIVAVGARALDAQLRQRILEHLAQDLGLFGI